MIDFFEKILVFLSDLSEIHNIDPVVFGVLYVGTIPLYLGSIGWIVKNQRGQKPLSLPVISTIFFFFLPAFYVALFGRNVAWYVYIILAFLIIYGGFSLSRVVRRKMDKDGTTA
jgi:hypothetical protein